MRTSAVPKLIRLPAIGAFRPRGSGGSRFATAGSRLGTARSRLAPARSRLGPAGAGGVLTSFLPSPRETPLTVAYLATLAATAWVLRARGGTAAPRLRAAVSTDVAHLRSSPLTVLAASALVSDQPWLSFLPLFCLSIAPLERRIGSARTAAVFATGHVTATLATELPLGAGISLGWVPASAANRLDVGASYGMYACTGALSVLLPPAWRRRALGAAAASTLVAALADTQDPVGSIGHPVALAVGALCGWALIRTGRTRSRPAPESSPRPGA